MYIKTVKFKQGYPARIEESDGDVTIVFNTKPSLIHELLHLHKGVIFNKAFWGLSYEVQSSLTHSDLMDIVLKANAVLDYYIYKKQDNVNEWANFAKEIFGKKLNRVKKILQNISESNVTEAVEKVLRVTVNKNIKVKDRNILL